MSVKRLLPCFVGLILALFLAPLAQAGAALTVTVSLAPQKYFLQKIGGARVAVNVMVLPGADAHVYEPRPSQMAGLVRSRIYFTLGLEFERAWLDRFKAANPALAFVATDAGIEKIPVAEPGHDDHKSGGRDGQASPDHDHEGLDPHVWLSPALVKVQARTVAAALAQADPADRELFEANLGRFLKELDALDAQIKAVIGGKNIKFLVQHPAWGYFARDYGLTQIALEREGKAPTARGLKSLIDQARQEGLKVVFVQPQVSDRDARTVAQAINGRVAAVDPLAEDWAGNLRQAAQAFKSAGE